MSIVSPWLPGARVLDLFAGSGALGLEALSRGAGVVDFVEVSPATVRAIRANAEHLGAGSAAIVHRADAVRFVATLGEGSYDLAFADPPYDLGLAARLAELWLETRFASILGIEHRSADALPGAPERRRYGNTTISLYGMDA